MRLSRRARAVVLVCVGLLLGGAAADVWVLDRPLPFQRKFRDGHAYTQKELEKLLTRVAPKLPPDMRSKLSEAVLLESNRAGYDPLFILAVVSVESRFRLRVSSERGAYGLIQLKPSTFAWISGREPDIGGDDYEAGQDPVIDVRLAVRYFRWLEKRFKTRDEALMAYNAGPRRIAQYKRPQDIPDKFREYPRRVNREYARFKKIMAGQQDSSDEVLLARVQ